MRFVNNECIYQNFRFMGIVTQDTKPPIFQSNTFFASKTILSEA